MARPARRPRTPAALVVLAVTVLALVTACSATGDTATSTTTATGATAPERPVVAVSTPLVGALVRSVAGDQVTVRLLRPGDPVGDEGADLVVRVTEEGPTAGAADTLVLAPQLNPIPLGGSELEPTSGAGAAATDPHVWLDPDRWTQAARLVAEALGELPTVDPLELDGNVAAFDAALSRADEALQATVATFGDERPTLVSDLPALAYLADRYGLDLVLADGATGLASTAREVGAPAVFVAADEQAARSAELAADAPGIAVIGLDLEGAGLAAAADAGPEDATAAYTDLLVTVATTLVTGLGG